MPSRAEMRVLIERVLRGIVIVVLAVMLWQSLWKQSDSASRAVSAQSAALSSSLSEWSTLRKVPGSIQVQLDNVPPRIERAWLGALAAAGSRLSWSGDVPATMIDAQPVASPTGGTRLLVGAPSGWSIVMSDDVGTIDTVQMENANASIALNSVAGNVTASIKGTNPTTRQREAVLVHKVLVIGEAGWESKFVVAALEEQEWTVDAFIRVAPTVDVRQGLPAIIDTSRYSAVVALDGAASSYATQIIEFVRAGGGAVLAPRAARLDALISLRAGSVHPPGAKSRATQPTPASLATLPFGSITTLRSDAVPLESQTGSVVSAARRNAFGRTLQIGYEDTWRWRMAGGEAAVRDHARWWTGLVSSVAYGGRIRKPVVTAATDEAPMIGLVAAIGRDTSTRSIALLSRGSLDWMIWLFTLLALGIVGEAGSRRLRGAS